MNRPKGKTSARGYGSTHQKIRKQWAPQVAAGLVDCARCGLRIAPGTPWDLGHDDEDRRVYQGPEHRYARHCPAGGNRATNRKDRRAPSDPPPRPVTRW